MTIRLALLTVYPYHSADEYRGGVMQSTFHLIKGLSLIEDLEVSVIAPTAVVGRTERRIGHGNVQVYYIPQPNPGYGSIVFYRGLRKAVSLLLEQLHPDIVHAIGVPAYSYVAIKSRIPHLITVHGILRNELSVRGGSGSIPDYVRNTLTVWYERYSFRHMANLVAISGQIESEVRRVNRAVQTKRIDNCVDDAFFAIDHQHCRPRILFVGGLARRKGLHVLLDAFGDVFMHVRDAELHIAGITVDPEYWERLKHKYRDLVQSKSICLLGEVSNETLVEQVKECSILCVPSLAESVPMVISQAMAAGKVVVASRVGGIPDMIVDGVSGRLCEVNDVRGLSRILVELLGDPGQVKRIGKQARHVASDKYRREVVAGETYSFYQQIVQRSLVGS